MDLPDLPPRGPRGSFQNTVRVALVVTGPGLTVTPDMSLRYD